MRFTTIGRELTWFDLKRPQGSDAPQSSLATRTPNACL